jgi:hypothetical protein
MLEQNIALLGVRMFFDELSIVLREVQSSMPEKVVIVLSHILRAKHMVKSIGTWQFQSSPNRYVVQRSQQ